MICPGHDYVGEVEDANRYNVELEDDGPKIVGKHKTDTPAWAVLGDSASEELRKIVEQMKREAGRL